MKTKHALLVQLVTSMIEGSWCSPCSLLMRHSLL